MKEKGYTLLELLVAVLLIGLVLMLYMASWSKAQSKARDGRRKADLAIVKLALEAYFNDNNAYPPNNYLTFGTIFAVTDDDGNVQTYMKQVPQDPLSPVRAYCYWVGSDSMSYFLGADFETEGRDPLWPCGTPGTPAPTIVAPPSGTPQPTVFGMPTQPPATQAPAQTPAPTPGGTITPYCDDCRRLVDQSINPSINVGYCCFADNPNGIYINNSCQPDAAGTGNYVGMTGCAITCSEISLQRWHQIAPVGDCITNSGFIGPGQQVEASCGEFYGCGSVIDYCTLRDDGCGMLYKYTSCICY